MVEPDTRVLRDEGVLEVCPGSMERMTLSGATRPAWKSSEWLIVPLLTSVMWKVSPMCPRRIGPGASPLKVHDSRVRELVTFTVCSVTVKV